MKRKYLAWRIKRNVRYLIKLQNNIRLATDGIISVQTVLNVIPDNSAAKKNMEKLERYLDWFGKEFNRVRGVMLTQKTFLLGGGV